MKIALEKAAPDSLKTNALIRLQFEGEKSDRYRPKTFIDSGEITGKALEFTILHKDETAPARRLVIAGAGKERRVRFGSVAEDRVGRRFVS